MFVAIAILLFAGSTILSWSLYGTLRGIPLGKKSRIPYQVLFVLLVAAGATMDLSLAWDIADTLNGLMAIPNLIALLGLSGRCHQNHQEYFEDKKRGAPIPKRYERIARPHNGSITAGREGHCKTPFAPRPMKTSPAMNGLPRRVLGIQKGTARQGAAPVCAWTGYPLKGF